MAQPSTPSKECSGSDVTVGSPPPRLRTPQTGNVPQSGPVPNAGLASGTGSSGRAAGSASSPGTPSRPVNLPTVPTLRQEVLTANLQNSAGGQRGPPPEAANWGRFAKALCESNPAHFAHFDEIVDRIEGNTEEIKVCGDRIEQYYSRLVEQLHAKVFAQEKCLAATTRQADLEAKWLYRTLFILLGIIVLLVVFIAWTMYLTSGRDK